MTRKEAEYAMAARRAITITVPGINEEPITCRRIFELVTRVDKDGKMYDCAHCEDMHANAAYLVPLNLIALAQWQRA